MENAGSMATVAEALTSGMSDITGSMAGLIGSILPVVLPIVGAVLVVKFGLKIFKMISAKA